MGKYGYMHRLTTRCRRQLLGTHHQYRDNGIGSSIKMILRGEDMPIREFQVHSFNRFSSIYLIVPDDCVKGRGVISPFKSTFENVPEFLCSTHPTSFGKWHMLDFKGMHIDVTVIQREAKLT